MLRACNLSQKIDDLLDHSILEHTYLGAVAWIFRAFCITDIHSFFLIYQENLIYFRFPFHFFCADTSFIRSWVIYSCWMAEEGAEKVCFWRDQGSTLLLQLFWLHSLIKANLRILVSYLRLAHIIIVYYWIELLLADTFFDLVMRDSVPVFWSPHEH